MKSYFEKLITPITEPKHINPRIKTLLPILALMFIASCNAQKNTVTLKVNTNGISDVGFVSVRGNIKPLSWSNNHELKDNDGDGIYESTIEFNTSKTNVKFKFIVDGITELEGSDSRVIWLKDKPITKEYTFNEYNFYTPAQINKIKYTDAQIEEDVAVLKKIVQYVHPTIYKFRDSVKMQEDFEVLEREMKNNPSISNVFGEVSKFAAKIKCSHTFTNPWNQGTNVDKAIFYQHDKIPFTFNRLGKRMFIDKNASDNNNLRKGLEIISINDVYTNEVLTRLSAYVTSDGSNYEKKLDRLSVTGEEKFSLFDIFYPIEFGSKDKFKLKLKDLKTNEEIEAVVNAVSKTSRTRTLIERYGNLATTLKEGWSFEIIDERTAKLSIKSFAVQRNEFDWKEYLDNVFEQLNKKSIANFIIDIRENEGGQGEVGEYILKRIIQKPIKIPAIQSSVRYNKIPEEFKKYINTWDKFPYDFSNKFSEEKDGRYILKQKYSVKGMTYKPHKDGFKGKSYLLTDASNSSATHLMAMYAKQIDDITIVGQETGGNQMGTNGSYIFFLKLPNTKIELDIPVINMVVSTGQQAIDGGVKPDITVDKDPEEFIAGVDGVLKKVMELIKNESQNNH